MEKPQFKAGQFCWTDLTVDNPKELTAFYKELFGWQEMEVPMKDADESYVDYAMAIDAATPGGGICHNRGSNMGIPPQWITYFYVDNVAQSLDKCLEMGGSLIKGSKKADGNYNYVIVKDPKGTVFGMVNM